MAKILVAYGTNSNGTLFASQVVVTTLKTRNHEVDLREVRNVDINNLKDYDLIVLGTNTWFYKGSQGQPHMWFFPFEEQLRKYEKKPHSYAIFALGDSSYMEFCHSAHYLEKMVSETGGKLISESLRIDGYYFDEKKNNKLLEAWSSKLAI